MESKYGIQLVAPVIFTMVILALSFKESAGLTVPTNISVPDCAGRSLLQIDNNVSQVSSRKSDDTVRLDPLDNFKKYRGGYDITNKHYWSSTVFTGVYGYVGGMLWLLCGVVYGGFLIAIIFCCKRKPKKRLPCYKHCYLWPFVLAIIFTILAITASGVILGGNARFHSQAKKVVHIIMNTANEASETIQNTTGAMRNMRDNLGASNENDEASGFLSSTSEKLNAEASEIRRQASKNRGKIDKGLKIINIMTIVTVSMNLIAATILSVCGILRLQKPLHAFIITCWFLTILCWLFFGMYFFLEKFSRDTCTALEHFQQNPYNNSLSSILPCDELLSAKPVLSDVSAEIYNLVNEVNANISLLNATAYPNLAYVCNPFSAPPEYQYQPDNCPANTIQIGDIAQILKIFACSGADKGTCKDGEFISASDYKIVEAYTTSVQNLLNIFPNMENLVKCQLVQNAFSDILTNHCKPLRRYLNMTWAAMLYLSIVMVALVLLWTTQALHDQELQNSDISAFHDNKCFGIWKSYWDRQRAASPCSV
ncbi:uncharacterized protein LOC110821423 isoform X2 [Carica papaya]|uniref:uncharacterized protein LOC110821423 isoform X2 n=1 Tax=Carica papaya TaxID=3649 RepID=UPI000B8CF492|nr:uncharacterized protein LOC110821423 isoform X2 [Carica papaya]